MASVDDLDTNTEFAASLGADFPLLSDPEGDVARAYGVVTGRGSLPYRWTYIIGPDGNILHVDRDVNPWTAGTDLVAHLNELGVARR